MKAVIPVAGVGSRLRPHTYTLPKVLLNVAGKPILGHILDALKEQQITKATIVTGYMGKLVRQYVDERYDMDVTYVSQKESLGLGHAIWLASETFDDEPLLIVLGDTIFDVDLSLASKSGFSSIGVKEVEDPSRFGVVVMNGENNIERMVEKPKDLISNLAIVGLYYIANPRLLAQCLNEIIDKNIKTKSEYQLTDALQMMIERGEKFTTFHCEGWYDCGKAETLLSTNRFLLKKNNSEIQKFEDSIIIPPVFIGKNATVTRSVIGPHTTVADGAKVEDSVVRDSIISDYSSVYSSLLEKSIIGNNAIVRGRFNFLNVGNSSEINYSS